MSDYKTFDLSSLCNEKLETILAPFEKEDERLNTNEIEWKGHTFGNSKTDLPLRVSGEQNLRGLPFLIGDHNNSSSENSLIRLKPGDKSISIPVDRKVNWLIFAQCISGIEKNIFGQNVAEYVFHTKGNQSESVLIRSSIEIGPIGGGAMGTFSDVEDSLRPRYEGEWGNSGWRQTERSLESKKLFHLWIWKNTTGNILESIEIKPLEQEFIIAGITSSNLQEHPITRSGRKPIVISMIDSKDADAPFDLEIEVDRGNATYTHPLPKETLEDFLSDDFKGWGESQNPSNSPIYSEISGNPSATVLIKSQGQILGEVNWGELKQIRNKKVGKALLSFPEEGRNWVKVEVVDRDDNLLPCRIHFRSPEGIPYQPYGHHNHVNSNLGTFNFDIGADVRMGQISYAYIDGKCEGWLPRGDVIVDIARGFEYLPQRIKVNIAPDQQNLKFVLDRWINMNDLGWYSGDAHVHFLSTMGAMLEAKGEDLNVVNLLQSQWGTVFTNTEDFIGEPFVSQSGKNIVYTCQENRQTPMGHLILWGLKEPVMPWCTGEGGECEIGATLETGLCHWADEALEQGATVILPHFGGLSGECVALIATGRAQGLEFIYLKESQHKDYYKALNAGYRMPLVGGTDKMSSDVPVGMFRTYAKLEEGQEFNYDNWCKAVTKGKTFLTSGPIIDFKVNGFDIGDTLSFDDQTQVNVEASAESIFPIRRLDIVLNGEVVFSEISEKPVNKIEISTKINIDRCSWIAVRCGGKEYWSDGNFSSSNKAVLRPMKDVHYDGQRKGIFAHSSPIYISFNGETQMFDEDVIKEMIAVLDADLLYLREISPQQDDEVTTHRHGMKDHLEFLSKPFLEAKQKLHKRLAERGILS